MTILSDNNLVWKCLRNAGMSKRHVDRENFQVQEYSELQRSIHKQILLEQKMQAKLAAQQRRQEKMAARQRKANLNGQTT